MRIRYNFYDLSRLGMLSNAEGEGGGAAGGAGEDAGAADAAAKATADAAAAKTATDAATAAAQDVKSLPDWAQKVITDARKEAGDARTNAKATAADEARAEMAQTLGKALGLVKGNTAPTADELAAQVKSSQTELQGAQVELAVYKAAGAAGANPVALLDSRSFLKTVAALDPTKNTFQTQVDAAIKTALTEHPELKVALAAARNGVNHSGGTGEGAKQPKPLDQALAAHYSR